MTTAAAETLNVPAARIAERAVAMGIWADEPAVFLACGASRAYRAGDLDDMLSSEMTTHPRRMG